MKLLTRRALVVLVLSIIILLGLVIFTIGYIRDASTWVTHASNRHLYTNAQLMETGTIYDRKGEILFQTRDGAKKYHDNKTVRTAVLHTIGDTNDNIATGAQVAFKEKLTGWNIVSGAYRFNQRLSHFKNDLHLTLDADVCMTAYNALKGRKGTVGVYNYKTGEILCMVSSPSFDPENPPDVQADPVKFEGVYINRLLSATYTPGSAFKLVTAAAAIDNLEDIDTRIYHCDGKTNIDGVMVTCPTPHGDVSFEQALAHSCNVAFAEAILSLGASNLQDYSDMAGFNSSLMVDGIRTAAGKVNVSDAAGGDLAWAGIGQYDNTANPLCFMAYVGSIANEGVSVSPGILKGNIFSALIKPVTGKKRILSEETAEKLGNMMRKNVIDVYGEGNYQGLKLCAKSGTAQVGEDKAPHAWFVGYMDREDCPLAFVVVVENGGSGSKVAGPVAEKVLRSAVNSMN
ncbi:MAG: penicillin-binding protein [Syntrophomonadaceae bacterium]|nr:penicillin-binding protein [Syntrophomonadaceae bacterium]